MSAVLAADARQRLSLQHPELITYDQQEDFRFFNELLGSDWGTPSGTSLGFRMLLKNMKPAGGKLPTFQQRVKSC